MSIKEGLRNWRDAKIPQWVKDSIIADLDKNEFQAALSWPTEERPQPVPFNWREYDRLTGTPVEGTYWAFNHDAKVDKITIKRREGGRIWEWEFARNESQHFTTNKVRGDLFLTERDARLACLWDNCEKFARKLQKIRQGF